MGKAPAFQFYIRDWLSDPQLRLASPSTRGIWIDLLCFMWEAPERGTLTSSYEQLSRLVGATNGDIDTFIEEAQALLFCDIVTDHNKNITLKNRRMARENNERKNNRLRQQRYRQKNANNANNGKITPPSSSSTSSSRDITKVISASGRHFKAKYNSATVDQILDATAKLTLICKELSLKFNPYQWIQSWANKNAHPGAILYSVTGLTARIADKGQEAIRNPWTYIETIMKTSNGNFWEKDNTSRAEKKKQLELTDQVLDLIKDIGK